MAELSKEEKKAMMKKWKAEQKKKYICICSGTEQIHIF